MWIQQSVFWCFKSKFYHIFPYIQVGSEFGLYTIKTIGNRLEIGYFISVDTIWVYIVSAIVNQTGWIRF